MERWKSIGTWIDEQKWSSARKVAAHAIAQRRIDLGMNPMSLAEWASWAARPDECAS